MAGQDGDELFFRTLWGFVAERGGHEVSLVDIRAAKQTAVARLTVTDNDGHAGTTTVSISIATFPGDFDGDVDQTDFATRIHNRLTGAFLPEFSVAGGGSRSVTKPDSGNWVLKGDRDMAISDLGTLFGRARGPGDVRVPAIQVDRMQKLQLQRRSGWLHRLLLSQPSALTIRCPLCGQAGCVKKRACLVLTCGI
jgi:hypothetical protein